MEKDRRIEEIKEMLAYQKELRAKSDEDRWAAMAYVRHRTPSQTMKDDCPVQEMSHLYSSAGVDSFDTFISGFMGSIMSQNQEWFTPRLVAKDYSSKIDPAYGISFLDACKNAMNDEMSHSNFYSEEELASRDAVSGGYSCTLVQNNEKAGRIFLQTLAPWRCYFDSDLQGNWNLFMYEYRLNGYELLEKFPDIDKSSDIYRDASVGKTSRSFSMLYMITERNRLRDSDGRIMAFGRNKKYAVLEICLDRDLILYEGGSDEFPVAIHVWQKSGDSQYGVGLVMKYLPEFRKLNRLGYEYGLAVAKINHSPWLVPDSMMDSFSDDPEARIAYQSREIIPIQLQENIDIASAGNALVAQEQAIRKMMFNDLFSYLSNTDKVYTATQVNAVKSESMSKLAPLYGNIQIQKIDPMLKMIYMIMVKNRRLIPDQQYVGKTAQTKIAFILDSSMSQMLANYSKSNSASIIIDYISAMLQMKITNIVDNINTDNLIRDVMISSGAPASFFVEESERDRKRQEQQQMAMMQMQMQNALTESEINRNNAGAANLNNIAGNNGGEQ